MTRLLFRLTLWLIDVSIWLISAAEWLDIRWERMRSRFTNWRRH